MKAFASAFTVTALLIVASTQICCEEWANGFSGNAACPSASPKEGWAAVCGKVLLGNDDDRVVGVIEHAVFHVSYHPCGPSDPDCESPYERQVRYDSTSSDQRGNFLIMLNLDDLREGGSVGFHMSRYDYGTCDISTSLGIDVEELVAEEIVIIDIKGHPDCDTGG
ncbi:hypothetical protein K8I61_03775 [bacterium]|nr:hypothetical protein [bacterium]